MADLLFAQKAIKSTKVLMATGKDNCQELMKFIIAVLRDLFCYFCISSTLVTFRQETLKKLLSFLVFLIIFQISE